MLLDLYIQVTNQAGYYQYKNTKNGLMLNIGGSATTNTDILLVVINNIKTILIWTLKNNYMF